MDLFLDNFTGAADAPLVGRTSDSGAMWQAASGDTATVKLDGAGRVRAADVVASISAGFLTSVAIPKEACSVEIVVRAGPCTYNALPVWDEFYSGLWGKGTTGVSFVNGAHGSAIGAQPTLCVWAGEFNRPVKTFTEGATYTILFEVDSVQTVRTYVDGVLVAAATGAVGFFDNRLEPFFARGHTTGAPFQPPMMFVDSFRVFSAAPPIVNPFWTNFIGSHEVP